MDAFYARYFGLFPWTANSFLETSEFTAGLDDIAEAAKSICLAYEIFVSRWVGISLFGPKKLAAQSEDG